MPHMGFQKLSAEFVLFLTSLIDYLLKREKALGFLVRKSLSAPPSEICKGKKRYNHLNIDLFLTKHGEGGLLCDRPFPHAPVGTILDAQTRELTLEFYGDVDTMHLNIPIEAEYLDMMLFSHRLYVGLLDEGKIAETVQVPMAYLHDPYGSDFRDETPLSRPRRSLIGFEQFMRRCVAAQPIHRDDLGDEGSAGSVLRGMDRNALQYVPQLVRQRMLEAAPKMGPSGMDAALSYGAPGAEGPKGPGGMGGGGGRPPMRRIIRKPQTGQDDKDS